MGAGLLLSCIVSYCSMPRAMGRLLPLKGRAPMQVRAILHLTAVLLAAALISGCSSTHVGEGGKAAEGMAQVRSGLTKAQSDVDQVLMSMDNIGRGDLKASFNTYNIEVSELHAMALEARKRARAMKDNSQQYMVTWEREAQEISDP